MKYTNCRYCHCISAPANPDQCAEIGHSVPVRPSPAGTSGGPCQVRTDRCWCLYQTCRTRLTWPGSAPPPLYPAPPPPRSVCGALVTRGGAALEPRGPLEFGVGPRVGAARTVSSAQPHPGFQTRPDLNLGGSEQPGARSPGLGGHGLCCTVDGC